MATLFKNAVIKNVGTEPIQMYEVGASGRTTVIGLSLTNLTESVVYVDVLVKDDTSVEAFYLKHTAVPPDSSLRAVQQGEKLILDSNNAISVKADIDDALDAVLSYVEVV
jgi:hypothetical protein